MRHGRIWRLILLLLIPALAAGALLIRLHQGAQAAALLDRAFLREEAVCIFHLDTGQGELNGQFFWLTYQENRYYSLEVGAERLYLHRGGIYLSNGRGYRIDSLAEKLRVPMELLRKICLLAQIRRSTDGTAQVWELSVPEVPDFLVSLLFPEAEEALEYLRSLKITLREESDSLVSVSVGHDAFQFHLQLTGGTPEPIPTKLLMEMGAGELPDIRSLEPLVQAGIRLASSERLEADATVRASCGPLSLEDSVRFRFSEQGLQLHRDGAWTVLRSGFQERRELAAGLCWYLVREGCWEPSDSGSGTFSLTIPASELQGAFLRLLPELEKLECALEDGHMVIHIQEGVFTGLALYCSGDIPFLITTLPLSVELKLTVCE